MLFPAKFRLPLALVLAAMFFYSTGQSQAQEKAPAKGETAAVLSLGDIIDGKADAPVTITEYSSFTCPHCANFHIEVYPTLKKKYIDTGKVKVIFRAFPLDPLAAAASMLTRCVDSKNYYAFVDLLFKQQKSWAYSNSPVDSLRKISLQAGLSSESFDKCLTNQKLLDGILKIKDTAAKVLEINSTPTFDVNGEVIRGGMPLKDFEKLIRAKLRK
jgi:protein-disulfide isomerase